MRLCVASPATGFISRWLSLSGGCLGDRLGLPFDGRAIAEAVDIRLQTVDHFALELLRQLVARDAVLLALADEFAHWRLGLVEALDVETPVDVAHGRHG